MEGSIVQDSRHYLDTHNILQDDDHDVISASSTWQLSTDMPQMAGDDDHNEMLSAYPNTMESLFSFLSNGVDDHQHLLTNGVPEWSADFIPFQYQLSPPPANTATDDQRANIYSSATRNAIHGRVSEHFDPRSPPPEIDVQEHPGRVSQSESTSSTRQPRRQNHSCDQCRSMKKACDLPLSVNIRKQKPSIACSTCNVRGVDCTTIWLASKQSAQPARKRARTNPYLPDSDKLADFSATTGRELAVDATALDVIPSISWPEASLVRQLAAQEVCSQQFNLYVDIIDMPVSQSLSQGCLPPCYSLGVAALAPLSNSSSLSNHLDKANLWIKSCWETNSSSWASTAVAPYTFHTVSVLDSLFQRSGAQASRASRNASITETYKWVAVATAAQFATSPDASKDKSSPKSRGATRSHSRDIASAAWVIAKQMVFGNLAATSSFRLAMSLLLFGLILPPTSSGHDSAFEEDTEYALCEGLSRLSTLCAKARASLEERETARVSRRSMGMGRTAEKHNQIQELPSDVKENVLELIGAIEWLVTMVNAAAITTSRGRVCPLAIEVNSADVSRRYKNGGIVQSSNANTLVVARKHDREIDESILMRAKAESEVFTTLWCKGPSYDVLLQAVRQSGSLAILLWKSLARFTLVAEATQIEHADCEEVHQRYTATLKIVEAWRATFGTFDDMTALCLQHSQPEIRRMVLFCSNDADLAILQFYDIAQSLQARIAEEPSTPARDRLYKLLQLTGAFRKEQRLLSAVQISTIASTCRGVSSPGFQGTSGLKAHVLDIAAHPYPSLIVQTLTLAAKAFVDEVHSSITQMDTKRASKMTVSLEKCLQGLQGLKETLVMFPDWASSDDDKMTL